MPKTFLCALALVATSASAAIPTSQRDALIALYNSTGGPSWTNRTGWLGAAGTECSWAGVRCNEEQTNVTELALNENNLRGTLPSELFRLTTLERLVLHDNHLSGEISPEIGRLRALTHLELNDNAFSGSIPTTLGDLTELDWLDLTTNRLTGSIPDSLRNLKKLTAFYLGYNEFSGEIPSWIGELTALTVIYFPGNQFTGVIPPAIGQLANLRALYLGDNRLTGSIPRDIGNLRQLGYLSLEYNEIGGPIPLEFFDLTELVEIRLNDMALTGGLPSAVGRLKKADVLLLNRNHLDGPIPPEIGDLAELQYLSLGANSFSGSIPPQIGNLKKVLQLGLYANALRGAVPPQIAGMTSLEDRGASFHHNAIYAADAATRDFVNRKQYDGDFEATQTLTPTNVRVTQMSDRSATVEWDLIRYTSDPGGYQVTATTESGAPVAVATTRTKDDSSIVVRGLDPTRTYRFTVAAVTHPHDFQANLLVSDPSAAVSGTTTGRVVAPPDVAVTESTTGLVQIDGVPANEDGFTLTNFGDTPTAITLSKEGSFFTVVPESFTLAGGASQRVILRSVPQPRGSYYGYIDPNGEGVGDDVYITPTLLSAARPAGTVIAEALSSRVEVAGAPGSDSVGQARFRNRGTAALSGIVLSDQPWVVPAADAITIHPGEVGTVNFTVVRSRRPPEALGALTANLSLVYVDGSTGSSGRGPVLHNGTTGVSVTLVTVVDTPKPPVAPSSPPGVVTGEVAWFAPGIASVARGFGRFVSDVSVLNIAGTRSISDLRLYFTPVTGSSSVASIGTITPSQAVTLANVVTNVYGADSATGSLQFRTAAWQSIAPAATLITSGDRGTHSGDVPIFRSDRAVAPGQDSYLAGLRKGGGLHSDIYLQETSGAPATVTVSLLDGGGRVLSSHQASLAPFAMTELLDVVSPSAMTAVVRNDSTSSGRVVGYARVVDEMSGDTWSIVDWPRLHRYTMGEAVRVPFVDGSPSTGGGRRRAVAHAEGPRSRTEVTMFNPGMAEARARMLVTEANGRSFTREVAVAPRSTLIVPDAGAGANSSTATLVVTPLGGEQMIVSARSQRTTTGTQGTSVPVLPATAGLRVGQSQRFPALRDSTLATVAAARPGTFRTTMGLVETSGSAVTVRARLFLDAGRDLAASVIYRDFTVGAGQQIVAEHLVRSIIGDTREALGELSGIQLHVEVVSGRGSVIPFVIVTDNGTGDTILRLE